MTQTTPILIVGAGPTGLTAACELARRGIPFRIIDKKSEHTHQTNATWIQPGSLEIFDRLGIAQSFIKKGHQCNAVNLYGHDKVLLRIPFDHLDSPYSFIIMLPQSETEKLLIDVLQSQQIAIGWNEELIDLVQTDDTVVAKIKNQQGKIEDVVCNWLIGCDGANSVTRQKCDIDFPGTDMAEQFVVADAKMGSFLNPHEIHVFFGKGTLFAAFPFGEQSYRIAANIHQSHPRKIFIEKEVIEIVHERTDGNYNVSNVSWISPFWIHSKIVARMQQGNVFLAGDAAHVHSPVGGQGMNSGIQDAMNLADKLVQVVQGTAGKSLLNNYHAERYPVVKQIVDETEQFTNLAVSEESFLKKLRKFAHEATPEAIQDIAKQIAQLNK